MDSQVNTCVCVDGFNLYYGAVKGTPYKWLNLHKFCQFMLPGHTITRIKYFTALVKPDSRNPDNRARQRTYIRALSTIPNIEVVRGHFLSHSKWMPLTNPVPGQSRCVEVVKTEEKGSDVNLATHLLWDGVQNLYDMAVIVSNDSDLTAPIKIVKQELGKRIIIINPHKAPSVQLQKLADEFKSIKQSTLQSCQFPHTLKDKRGSFCKPACW